jgi:hypothetical protein
VNVKVCATPALPLPAEGLTDTGLKTGVELLTFTVTLAEPVFGLASLSVAVTVMVCAPALRPVVSRL